MRTVGYVIVAGGIVKERLSTSGCVVTDCITKESVVAHCSIGGTSHVAIEAIYTDCDVTGPCCVLNERVRADGNIGITRSIAKKSISSVRRVVIASRIVTERLITSSHVANPSGISKQGNRPLSYVKSAGRVAKERIETKRSRYWSLSYCEIATESRWQYFSNQSYPKTAIEIRERCCQCRWSSLVAACVPSAVLLPE